MKKLRSIFLHILVTGVVLIGFAIFWNRIHLGNSKSDFSITVSHQLSALQELATYSYSYSDFAIREDTASIAGISIPGTTNKVIVMYSGVIKAGIDLGSVEIQVDSDEKVVSIKLPDATILSNVIDAEDVKTYEVNNLFNPISSGDLVGSLQEEKERHLEQAKNEGLLSLSEDQAKSVISALFSAYDDYSIVFD